jgi:type II secretion system protein C
MRSFSICNAPALAAYPKPISHFITRAIQATTEMEFLSTNFFDFRGHFCYFYISMKAFVLDRLLKGRNTITVINIVIGLLLLAAVLLLARDALSLAVSRKGPQRKPEGKTQRMVWHSLQDYGAVMKNNPFGFPAGQLTPLSAAAAPSISQTDLSLIGTIAGRSRYSYAIFSDKTGKQDIFKVGDDVFGLGTLKKVGKSSVVIHSRGKDVEVPFADLAVVKEVGPGVTSPRPMAMRSGSTSFLLNQQQIQQALSRPDQLMTDARFIPNIVAGKQQGFTVREIKPGGIYQKLGLQNGDVLLRINDFTMSSPDSALQAITSLKGIDRAQLDILRRGAKLTMTYQIR